MKLRLAGVLVLALAACKPAVKGLCSEQKDCRDGSYCSLEGICLAASGTCSPACKAGEICSGSTCAPLKPRLTVIPPAGPISPASPQVTVHVDASPAIALHALSVEVGSDQAVASGSIGAPQAGDNVVTLTTFQQGVIGDVSVRATLRYLQAGAESEVTLQSVALPATIDAAPPSVSVFVPAGQGEMNGWVARTSGTLEVRATVSDGGGSGAQAATLAFDKCPAAVPCNYPGTAVSQAAGTTVFSFQVPRAAQAAGAEKALAVTVTGTDVAGNAGTGAGTLQIDGAPPQIGALILVTAGVSGEDGKTWFPGGATAPDVEIAVPFTDKGSGPASVALHLVSGDLGGFPGPFDLPGTPMADGVHFRLPANAVRGREGPLRFTLTTMDLLGNTGTFGPDSPNTMIQVDAVPPMVTQPHVVYSSAAPASACGTGATLSCGRQSGRLLPDDNATVTFDAYDCGSGLHTSTATLTASTTAGGPQTVSANEQKPVSTGSCSNGNALHHFQLALNLATLGAVLDPPIDLNGTTLLQLAGNIEDRVQSLRSSDPGTTGDGVAQISLWRWKNQVTGAAATFAGAPALVPGSGSRQIAVATSQASGANVFVLKPDGSIAWSATAGQLATDVAVGSSGRVYAVGPSSATTGYLAIALPPGGNGTVGTIHTCTVDNVNLGTAPAVVIDNTTERAVASSSGHSAPSPANVFVFTESSGCQKETGPHAVGGAVDWPGGISASWPTIYVANGQGFASETRGSGASFDATTFAPYVTASAALQAPPAIAPQATAIDPKVRAFFGTTDKKVRAALPTTGSSCGLNTGCWIDDQAFPAQSPANAIPATPVFDGSFVYAADAAGALYAYPFSSGTAWSVDFRAATLLGLPAASATISPPVVVQNGTALVVRSDGVVALAASATAVSGLLQVGGGAAPAPVVDARGAGGIAYVADGQGTVWAVHIPVAPLAANQSNWPRPGRDSCNSRNAASSCP